QERRRPRTDPAGGARSCQRLSGGCGGDGRAAARPLRAAAEAVAAAGAARLPVVAVLVGRPGPSRAHRVAFWIGVFEPYLLWFVARTRRLGGLRAGAPDRARLVARDAAQRRARVARLGRADVHRRSGAWRRFSSSERVAVPAVRQGE